MEITKIDGTLPLHDFPSTYNDNNKKLADEITNLQNQLEDIKKQHNEDIHNLQSMYNNAINNIKKDFDVKMTEFEKKFVDMDGFDNSVKQIISNTQTGK